MLYLLDQRVMMYGAIAVCGIVFLFLILSIRNKQRSYAHHGKLRMGVNPINDKPHPINFIPKDKLMSKERFVTRYEGIPSSIYEPDPRKRKRY